LFLKDNLDIKKFDILAIYGYKGKSDIPRISEIHRFKLEDLIEKAKKAKKYDPNDSVALIRAKRDSERKRNSEETSESLGKNFEEL